MKSEMINELSGSESDGSDEDKDNSSSVPHKRRRFSDDERRTRCRERNKIHARNTRERKRVQMETLQQNIQDLIDEKVRLTNMLPDSSIASILMSLNQTGEGAGLLGVDTNIETGRDSGVSLSEALLQQENEISKEVRRRANLTIEKLRLQVSALLNVDEELDINQLSNGNSSFTDKDRSKFTKAELGQIRRERNRLHAKKTRLKKKKMLAEMELIISGLQDEISILKGETANISNSSCSNGNFMSGLPSSLASAPPANSSSSSAANTSSSSSSLARSSNLNFADLGFARSNSSLLQYFNPQLSGNGGGGSGSGGALYSGQQSFFGADSSLFGPFVDVARTVAAMSAYSDRQTNMDAGTATTTSSNSNPSLSPGGYHHHHQHQASSLDEYENSPLALILAASSIREGSFDRTSKSDTGSTDSSNERDSSSDHGNYSGAEDTRGDQDRDRDRDQHRDTHSVSSRTNTSKSSSSEGKEKRDDDRSTAIAGKSPESNNSIIATSVGRPDPF